MPEQQLAQELSAFERHLHSKIIFDEIWKVEGASMVPIFALLLVQTMMSVFINTAALGTQF